MTEALFLTSPPFPEMLFLLLLFSYSSPASLQPPLPFLDAAPHMTPDIFSSFDPHLNSSMFWALLLLIPISFSSLWSHKLYHFLPMGDKVFAFHLKPYSHLLMSIFFLILTLNTLGLLPYFFSYSSHMILALPIALIAWLGPLMSSATNNLSSFMASFLPSGAPAWLSPFLLIIEIISSLIRPITLSFRLVANISTGHIVLCLLGLYSTSSLLSLSLLFPLIILAKVGYLLFEFAIAFLQAYIFSTLLALYTNDHSSTDAGRTDNFDAVNYDFYLCGMLPLFLSPLTLTSPPFGGLILMGSSALSLLFIPKKLSLSYPLFSIDSMTFNLVVLTMWISSLMFLASFKIIDFPFFSLVAILALILATSFAASDFLRFYILFEASLLPTLTIILVWGYQPERLQAGMYFMMYTIISSLSLLILIFNHYALLNHIFIFKQESLLIPFLISTILILPFLVKIPMYSFHLWLPKAHVEAPVAGSMILAAILLKLGAYGLIRVTLMAFLEKIKHIISPLAILGAALTSIICIHQTDLKALIAYSSVAHMGLLISATLSMTTLGWSAALIIMIAHGLASSSLFALANMTYETTKSRALILSKGLLSYSPPLTLLWFLSSLTNMSAPPSLNFFGELMALPPSITLNPILTMPITPLLFFSGAYSLILYTSIAHGPSFSPTKTPNKSRNFLLILLHLIPLSLYPLKLSNMLFNQ